MVSNTAISRWKLKDLFTLSRIIDCICRFPIITLVGIQRDSLLISDWILGCTLLLIDLCFLFPESIPLSQNSVSRTPPHPSISHKPSKPTITHTTSPPPASPHPHSTPHNAQPHPPHPHLSSPPPTSPPSNSPSTRPPPLHHSTPPPAPLNTYLHAAHPPPTCANSPPNPQAPHQSPAAKTHTSRCAPRRPSTPASPASQRSVP